MAALDLPAVKVARPHPPIRIVVIGILLVIIIATAFAADYVRLGRQPELQFVVPLAELSEEPRHYFARSADEDRPNVHLVRNADGSVNAFLATDPFDGCTVPWRPEQLGTNYRYDRLLTGVFRSPCHGATYGVEGDLLTITSRLTPTDFATIARGLDRYETRVRGDEVIVDLSLIRLGSCRPEATSRTLCSRPDAPVYRTEQPSPLLLDILDGR